jgi:copper chaperone CopZ
MTHEYKVSGITCAGCQAKVQGLLMKVPGVGSVQVEPSGLARISMNRPIETAELSRGLADHPAYRLSEIQQAAEMVVPEEKKKNLLETYKPLLLIFGYILALSLITAAAPGTFRWQAWMNHFMAGFFLVFSFFKLLDLKGFAGAYAMYDIVAGRWKDWGYIYAFIELGLGFAFLTGFRPVLTNAVTLLVMTVSITGVLQSVMDKRKIRCACLGAVFNLPMSTVTILEDGLMIAMSGIMLITML